MVVASAAEDEEVVPLERRARPTTPRRRASSTRFSEFPPTRQLPLPSPYGCRVSGYACRRKRLGRRFLELARSGEQRVDHGRIGECRCVSEPARFAFCDLAKDSAHDLAGAGLREGGRELNALGCGQGSDLAPHFLDQLGAKLVAAFLAGVQRHVGVDRLALDLVREGYDRGLGYEMVSNERAFDFGRADAVAGDVDHVVDAAGDPVIAVLVAAAAVAGEILTRIGR